MSTKRKASGAYTPAKKARGNTGATSKHHRCWATEESAMLGYHDNVWGRPETDTARLFESMVLQLMQCGINWRTVYNKREHFRTAFANYDLSSVAAFDAKKIQQLMDMPTGTIIRNRSKIDAVVNNARLIVAMDAAAAAADGGDGSPTFAEFLWQHCPANDRERLKVKKSESGNHMRSNFKDADYASLVDADGVHPTKTVVALSKALKARGFKYMGPTTTLSLMQAVGLVNHHGNTCFVFKRNEAELKALRAKKKKMTAKMMKKK